MRTKLIILISILFFITACRKKYESNTPFDPSSKNLTIFFVNDQHGQLSNFSKIKHIVDKEKQEGSVIIACSGDMFSGNPVVDNYPEKGYPMIDLMNQVGFDVSVVGNHEFDYGEDVLKDRFEQANFDWVCANVDMGSTAVPQPYAYTTISIDSLRITFLGLIETDGKDNATIPSTHPFRVQNFTFISHKSVVADYAGVKQLENADLFVALTHIGSGGYYSGFGDYQLAQQFPYFDLIIGGHSHEEMSESINGIPIFQAGSYLNKLGRIELSIKNKKVSGFNYTLINLSDYPDHDAQIKSVIDGYNTEMSVVLDDVIGYSHRQHDKSQVGCFYTDALRAVTETDVSFQNSGGIRSGLGIGNITVREIYEIDPFHNNTVIYQMSVQEIKAFLKGSASGFYYSGIQLTQLGNNVVINDQEGNPISDNTILSVGINDYIPAVYDNYFPASGEIQDYNTAEAIIAYLVSINDQIDYPNCYHYFQYQ